MLKRRFRNTEKKVSVLGMGGMRFPTLENGEIDVEKAEQIIDLAYSLGVNYYDTAYIYHGGKSEEFMGKALSKYPRDSYFLTDKLPIWMTPTPEDVPKVFDTQLERCGVEYFDFYLCHALNKEDFQKFKEFGAIDFLFEKKKDGKIRNIGFSFHDTPEVLDEILSEYDWDLCQIQLNYFDWDYQRAEEQYAVAKKHGVQVVVMEPVRGGALADLGDKGNSYLKAVNPDRSIASWAIRFAMEKENVLTVLSGMGNTDQVRDNVATASGELVLSDIENEAIKNAVAEYRKSKQIPCTACNYCAGCPVGIDIRSIFKAHNKDAFSWSKEKLKAEFEKNKADACIRCGKCASVCPQGIDIPKELEEICKIVKKN